MSEHIEKAPNVPPFVTFVTSTVPMVFDNSLSYYEALCALWKWLQDDVVNVINNNATVTENYIEMDEETRQLFIELKSYVDNYFDNLDVQDEINNKLDAMVEAGTLQEIITTYIQSKVAWTFDTVADMKQATNLVDGSYARTLGFRSINDGGGALYKITNTGTANEQDIIALTGSLLANLITPSEVTPEIYGAYCDGTHNDAPAIQAAINSGKPVLMSKNYYTTSSVYIGNQDPSINQGWKNNVVLNGSNSTVTYASGNSAFVIAGVEGGKLNFGTIKTEEGSCIEMWSTNGNVRVAYVDLSFNLLSAGEKAIYIHNQVTSSGTGFINEITVDGGTIRGGDYGLYVTDSRDTASPILGINGHHYYNICFEGCDSNIYLDANNCCIRDFEFNGIRYEENRDAPLLTFTGNVFRQIVFNGTFPIYEARIDYTGATHLYGCIINAPIADGNLYSSTKIASGIVIDNNVKNYLNDGYNTKSLTRESNAYGTIELDRYMNQVVINFAGIGSDLSDGTLVIADNMPIKPNKRAMCSVSSNTNTTAYVVIDTDGKITLHRRTGDAAERYWGQMTILSYSPKRGF